MKMLVILLIAHAYGNKGSHAMTQFPDMESCELARAAMIKATKSWWSMSVTKDNSVCISISK